MCMKKEKSYNVIFRNKLNNKIQKFKLKDVTTLKEAQFVVGIFVATDIYEVLSIDPVVPDVHFSKYIVTFEDCTNSLRQSQSID
jgi:hypothetical protein